MEWFEVSNSDQILTPALLFYPARIKKNIEQMIRIAGSAERLRPHIKTYKCREIVQLQMDQGISKFKCSTLVEAEMLAKLSVPDLLLAYPLVGPAQKRWIELIEKYPNTRFSTLVDHSSQAKSFNEIIDQPIDVFIDINVGMNRTGMNSKEAYELYQQLNPDKFHFRGLHVYDGHLHQLDIVERTTAVDASFEPVATLIDQLDTPDSEIVCGGSLSFPIHAKHIERTLSPGTTLLWDHGYAQFSDLPFDIAATILTRVVSKPSDKHICLDLGHKSVASEMKDSPIYFPQLPNAIQTTHSEEHLVLEVADSSQWQLGDVLYGYPRHICPTVALHECACIVEEQKLNTTWQIEARKRNYTL